MRFDQELYVLIVNLSVNVNGMQHYQRSWMRTIPRELL